MEGFVFNIQRFSIHDGPGIRTTVFMKGCSLRCFWCHNPEGIRLEPEIQVFPERCIGCNACLAACTHGAHTNEGGQRSFYRERCQGCGTCVETCYAGALVLTGRRMTVDEVISEVLRDRPFYETSGGGVTLSGGEPLVQRDFARAILERCRAEGLHTALETAGNCRWEDLAVVLEFSDLILMDIKLMDPARHRQATGVGNERILANARRLVQAGQPVIFRVPVVPTVNDSAEDIAAIADFVHSLAAESRGAPPTLELLPFHRMAGSKYQSLGLDYRAAELEPSSKEYMTELEAIARQRCPERQPGAPQADTGEQP